jgi:hypothetical protein
MTLMRTTQILHSLFGPRQSSGLDAGHSVTFRYATPDDALALLDLAALDSNRAPSGTVLVAEVGGRLWAAQSLDDGHSIADPFSPSGELSFLLAERARQIGAASAPRSPRRRLHLTAA